MWYAPPSEITRRRRPRTRPVRSAATSTRDPPLAGVDSRRRGSPAALDPLDRTLQPARRRGHRHVLGEHVHLQAEAAADVGDDHADRATA